MKMVKKSSKNYNIKSFSTIYLEILTFLGCRRFNKFFFMLLNHITGLKKGGKSCNILPETWLFFDELSTA